MNHQDFDRRELLRLFAGSSLLFLPEVALAQSEPIAVVMASTSRQSSLSLDALRRIFLAKPSDDDNGNRFVPVNHAQSNKVRELFDRRVLRMEPDEVARFWIDQRLRGKKAPRTASSPEVVRRAVEELPGAISYLPLSGVGALHVVAIDGRAPNDAAYPVR